MSKPYKNSVPRNYIENHSLPYVRSSKLRFRDRDYSLTYTTYSSTYQLNQNKGLWAEHQVIEHYKTKKWVCVGRRKKLKFGEVDLIFKSGQQLHFVEVKFLNDSWNIFERVSRDQKRQLSQNRVYYSLRYKVFHIESWIAFVSRHPQSPKTSNLDLIHLEE